MDLFIWNSTFNHINSSVAIKSTSSIISTFVLKLDNISVTNSADFGVYGFGLRVSINLQNVVAETNQNLTFWGFNQGFNFENCKLQDNYVLCMC